MARSPRGDASVRRLGGHEQALLLRWLRLAPEGPAAAPPGPDVDWQALSEHVAMSLSPLVLRAVSTTGAAGVPPSLLEQLRVNSLFLASRHLRQRLALRRAAAALAAADIPLLVLKGAALAYLVYPEPALRPMTDMDLWVPPDRLAAAEAVLGEAGFRRPPEEATIGAPLHLDDDSLQVRLELHDRPQSLEGLEFGDFEVAWGSGLSNAMNGIPARVLCPPHQLAHVCLHLGRSHLFDSSLLRLVDVARIIERWRDDWDWGQLARDWERQDIAAWMLLGVTLARDLLGAPAPPGLEASMALRGWPSIRALATAQLWEASTHRLGPVTANVVRLGWTGALRLLRDRLYGYWAEPARGQSRGKRVIRGLRLLTADLRRRGPLYARALARITRPDDGTRTGLAHETARRDLLALVAASKGGHGPVAPPAPSRGG